MSLLFIHLIICSIADDLSRRTRHSPVALSMTKLGGGDLKKLDYGLYNWPPRRC